MRRRLFGFLLTGLMILGVGVAGAENPPDYVTSFLSLGGSCGQ